MIKGNSEEVKFTGRKSDMLSTDMFLTESISLEIRADLNFTAPITSVFMHVYLEDTEMFSNSLDIKIHDLYFEITLFRVDGCQGDKLKLVMAPRFNFTETEYRVFLAISRLYFFYYI